MLSCIVHEKSFYNLKPGHVTLKVLIFIILGLAFHPNPDGKSTLIRYITKKPSTYKEYVDALNKKLAGRSRVNSR